MYKLGIIGSGHMGMAILDGAVQQKTLLPEEIATYNRNEKRANECREKGFAVLPDEKKVMEESRILLIGVKPQDFGGLMQKLSMVKPPEDQLIVSIAVGVSMAYIAKFLPYSRKIVRAMPNTPILIGEGAAALARTKDVTDEEFRLAESLFTSGDSIAVEIPEDKMNEVSIVNGSSPAFVYYFIEALARTGEGMGIDYDKALDLAIKTFIGSSKMLKTQGKPAQQLIDEVCSPGGTTIEAVKHFDEKNLKDIIREGCEKSVKRAYELGK